MRIHLVAAGAIEALAETFPPVKEAAAENSPGFKEKVDFWDPEFGFRPAFRIRAAGPQQR